MARETRAQRAKRRREAQIGWEYHQDGRDRAAAEGALIIIGIGVLIVLGTIAAFSLLAIELMRG